MTRRRSSPRWATTSSRRRTSSRPCAKDAHNPDSKHDMGGNIIPWFVARGGMRRLRLPGQRRPPRPTATATTTVAVLSTPTTTRTWTSSPSTRCSTSTTASGRRWTMIDGSLPPAKFVYGDEHLGWAMRSIPSSRPASSSPVARSTTRSFSNCYVHSWAQVTDSVLMHGCRIGRHAVVAKAILDKNVVVEEARSSASTSNATREGLHGHGVGNHDRPEGRSSPGERGDARGPS